MSTATKLLEAMRILALVDKVKESQA